MIGRTCHDPTHDRLVRTIADLRRQVNDMAVLAARRGRELESARDRLEQVLRQLPLGAELVLVDVLRHDWPGDPRPGCGVSP